MNGVLGRVRHGFVLYNLYNVESNINKLREP